MGGKGKSAGYPEPSKDIHKYFLSTCCMQRLLLGTMDIKSISGHCNSHAAVAERMFPNLGVHLHTYIQSTS